MSGPTSLAGRARSDAVGGGSENSCSLMFENLLVTDRFAYAFDSVRKLSYVFTRGGWSFGDSIVRHEIDADLNVTTTVLPLSIGTPWLAMDLDMDGQLELVVQRSGGLLDIHSAPDWRLRARLVFPGMCFWMHPTPVNADGDTFLELYATPMCFGPALGPSSSIMTRCATPSLWLPRRPRPRGHSGNRRSAISIRMAVSSSSPATIRGMGYSNMMAGRCRSSTT